MKPIKSCRIWCVWIIAALYVPYQFLLQTSPSVMIPELMHTFSINVIDIGFLSSCFFYSYIFLQVPSGILIDRYGARVILTITISLCASACLLFALSWSFLLAELSRFLMGIVASTSVVAALYLASRWFSAERFGLLAGIMEMLGMLGGAVGQASLAKCVACWGWRQSMIIFALLGFLLALLVWLLVRDGEACMPAPLPDNTNNARFYKQLSLIFANQQLWFNGLYCGLIFAIMSGFAGLWSVPYLTARYQIPATIAAYYTAIVFIGAAIGGPVLGWLAGKLHRYRIIMMSCAVGALLIFSIIIYVPMLSLPLLAILLFLLGFMSGAYTLSFMVTREHTTVNIRGAAMGFTNMMCILIGAPVIQPLIGYLLASQNTTISVVTTPLIHYQFALNSFIICLALAAVSCLMLKDKKDQIT